MEVMKTWMAQRITEVLEQEDDVTVDFAYELLTDKSGARFNPNIKLLQIKMQGFLGEEQNPRFCNDLWDLMLSAQDSGSGVPTQLLEAKKAELLQERVSIQSSTSDYCADTNLNDVGCGREASTRREKAERA
jgi:serine/arginine repetitive matrix protein 1